MGVNLFNKSRTHDVQQMKIPTIIAVKNFSALVNEPLLPFVYNSRRKFTGRCGELVTKVGSRRL